jgi:hypothetical protein
MGKKFLRVLEENAFSVPLLFNRLECGGGGQLETEISCPALLEIQKMSLQSCSLRYLEDLTV